MEVDQKHITTIRLHDAKGSDFVLIKDGRDYQLKIVSQENVVNITLGAQDLLKLCQQIIQVDLPQKCRTATAPVPEPKSFVVTCTQRHPREVAADWHSYIAAETTGESSNHH